MYVKRNELTCKDVEKMVASYVDEELDINELEAFMSHVETCANCREELSIQFLVSTGLKSLEAGNNFDLNYELLESIEHSKKKVQKKRMFQKIVSGTIIIVVVSVCVTAVICLCFLV